MALAHFFLDEQIISDETSEIFPLKLSKDDLRHVRVLRLRKGEHIGVIDAAQDYFECEITSVEDVGLCVRIASHLDVWDNYHLVLLQGLAKSNKMDDIVRHATEIGISEFVPLLCERSVVKLNREKTLDRCRRWKTIAKSAAMQAGRMIIPEVSDPLPVEQACLSLKSATCVLIFWEEADQSCDIHSALQASLSQTHIEPRDAHIGIVIGPEGGLSEDEVKSFSACNPQAHVVTLGNSILRTETAALVAVALVLYELGGLGNIQSTVGGVDT